VAIRVRTDELDRVGSGPRRLGASPHEAGRETAELYEAYGTLVFRYAWHMLRRKEDAEDAAQATFLSVYAALSAGTAVLEPKAWVLRIVRNECLARLGRAGQAPSELDAVAEPASRAPSTEQQAELRSDVAAAQRVLERLPAPQREAFVLREWLGLSTYEVAQACGTSVSAVDALLQRARRSLVQTVGASEGAVACDHAQKALAADRVDRRTRAHILRCPTCRASRRRLGLPRPAIATAIVPAGIAARLSDLVPGFTAGGAVGAAAAGAGAGGAALKVASLPVVWKAAAAGLALLTVTGGVAAVRERGGSAAPPVRPAAQTAPAHGGAASAGAAAAAAGGRQVAAGGGEGVAPASGGRDRREGRSLARGDGGRADSGSGAGSATARGGDGSGEQGRVGSTSRSGERDGAAATSGGSSRSESDSASGSATASRERQSSTGDRSGTAGTDSRSGSGGSTADGGSASSSGTDASGGSSPGGGSDSWSGPSPGATSSGTSGASQPSSGTGGSSDPTEQP
jgi:RNA polymerase sigma factor (sigma-70 family)